MGRLLVRSWGDGEYGEKWGGKGEREESVVLGVFKPGKKGRGG